MKMTSVSRLDAPLLQLCRAAGRRCRRCWRSCRRTSRRSSAAPCRRSAPRPPGAPERRVRGVGGDVGRRTAACPFARSIHFSRLREEDVGAVALRLLERPLCRIAGSKYVLPGASPQEPGYVWPMPPAPWMNISSKPRATASSRVRRRDAICRRCRSCTRPLQHLRERDGLGWRRSRSRIVCVTPFRNSCRRSAARCASARRWG